MNLKFLILVLFIPTSLQFLPIHTTYSLSLMELAFMDFTEAMGSYNLPYDTNSRAFLIVLGVCITGICSLAFVFFNLEKKIWRWLFWSIVLLVNFAAWGSTILSKSALTGQNIEWTTAQGLLIVSILLQAFAIYKHPKASKLFGF
jgi:hypothetical protein